MMEDRSKLYIVDDPSGPPPDCRPEKKIIFPATKEGRLALTMTAKIADNVPAWRTRAGLIMIAVGAALIGVRMERA
jgi:hypothetical protein